MNLSSDLSHRYLCFSLGEEEFAVPLLTVKEVIAVPETTPIPFMQPYFLGIMNLRGLVISIIDLRTKLKIKPRNTNEDAVIILDFGDLTIGVVVDAVNSVLNIKSEDVGDSTKNDAGGKFDFITGIFRKESRLVLLIDLKKTLNPEDITMAKHSAKKVA